MGKQRLPSLVGGISHFPSKSEPIYSACFLEQFAKFTLTLPLLFKEIRSQLIFRYTFTSA